LIGDESGYQDITLNGGSGTGYNITYSGGTTSGQGRNIQTYNVGNYDAINSHNNLQPYITTKYIIKAFQSSGVIAEVSNTYSQSTTNTYACNYINNKLSGIIESGGNADGYYTKYADGTLICRGFIGPMTIPGNSGTSQNVTFPYTFIDTNWSSSLTKTGGGAYWSWIAEVIINKSKTGFTVGTWNNNANQSSDNWYDYIVIGRWK
jgi:hypothetical protein